MGKRAVRLPSGLSEFPHGSGRGRHARGDARRLVPIPGEGTGWGSRGALPDVCADLCVQLLLWGSHRSGARCEGTASAVYRCSPRSIPGWVLHGEPRWRNFFLYTVGVNQHFGKCNYRFTSCGNLWVSHTWSVWSSSMAQLSLAARDAQPLAVSA